MSCVASQRRGESISETVSADRAVAAGARFSAFANAVSGPVSSGLSVGKPGETLRERQLCCPPIDSDTVLSWRGTAVSRGLDPPPAPLPLRHLNRASAVPFLPPEDVAVGKDWQAREGSLPQLLETQLPTKEAAELWILSLDSRPRK